MNCAWDLNNQVGLTVHTEQIQLESIIDQKLLVADFPGSTSLNKYAENFRVYTLMKNMIVIILMFTGHVDQAQCDESAKVYKSTKSTKKEGSKIIICFNQMGNYLDRLEEELHNKKDCADYLRKKNAKKLNEQFFQTNQELEVLESDIFFTDWEYCDPTRLRVNSVQHIKQEIEKRIRYQYDLT